MLRDGGVPVIARVAQMRRDPLALAEHLHRAGRQPRAQLFIREAIGHAVVMPLDFDMIIETK
jgi:hypothetical protein